MQIARVEVHSIKKIKDVVIEPPAGGGIIVITGKNKQGKSSFLDALFSVFGGKGVLPDVALNQETGAKAGNVKVVLTNGLTLERKVTASGTTLTVVNENGQAQASPQKYVDDRLKHFSFNPAEYFEASAAARAEINRKIANMLFDVPLSETVAALAKGYGAKKDTAFDTIEALIKPNVGAIYMQRRDVKRDLEAMSALGAAEDVPNIEAAQAALEAAIAERDKIRSNVATLDAVCKATHAALSALTMLDAALPPNTGNPDFVAIREIIPRANAAMEYAKEKLRAQEIAFATTDENTNTARAAVSTAQALAAQAKRNADAIEKRKGMTATLDRIEKEMALCEDERARIMAEIKMPIEGMSLTDGKLFLDGIPFEQCSQSQKMMASIRIAMSLNPDLRVMRMQNGNLLDDETFSELRAVIEKNDFQLWVEYVGHSEDGIGFEFVDGELKDGN